MLEKMFFWPWSACLSSLLDVLFPSVSPVFCPQPLLLYPRKGESWEGHLCPQRQYEGWEPHGKRLSNGPGGRRQVGGQVGFIVSRLPLVSGNMETGAGVAVAKHWAETGLHLGAGGTVPGRPHPRAEFRGTTRNSPRGRRERGFCVEGTTWVKLPRIRPEKVGASLYVCSF